MSSSDVASTMSTFWRAFAASIVCTLLALAVALVVIDPIGTGPGNAVCRAGAKTSVAQYVKPHLPAAISPRTVVIGTSRVHYGFDSIALEGIGGPQPVANLGIDASLPSDWGPLGDEVLRHAERPLIFLGTDFNATFMAPEKPMMKEPDGGLAGLIDRLRSPWLSDDAMRALPGALPDCDVLIYRDGTPARDAEGLPRGWVRTDPTAAIVRTVQDADMDRLMEQRLAQMQALLHRWRAAGATVVVFSAPYRSELLDVYRAEGVMPVFAEYHARLGEIATQEGAGFVDFTQPEELAALDLAPCPSGGIGCHYFDVAHYLPAVPHAMAPRLRQVAEATLARDHDED